MTWPVGRGWPARLPLPPVLQLDHVLVSPDVQVRSARTIEVPGSDHRGISTQIVLP